MTKSVNTRALVLEVLTEILENNKKSSYVINNTLDKYAYLDKKDRSFIKRISEGTIEKLIELDYIIDSFSKIKVKKMKPYIRNLLRLSVYQIKYMDSIPDRAVCDEAVKLIQKSKYRDLKSFVNGVLRNICREINNIPYPDKEDKLKFLSVKYSVPEWIIEKWLNEKDEQTVNKILEGINREKDITIRLNQSKISKERLIELLNNRGISVRQHKYLNEALIVKGMDKLTSLEEFVKGYFYVQDVSSMFVAKISGVKKDDYCIDVCAAPGGKSMHLAELLNGSGVVDSRDISKLKADLIHENVSRMGYNNVKIKVFDAREFDEESVEKADVVIADLPCSGLGVIGKKNDIKFRINKSDIDSLQQLQREILNVVCKYVKIGGVLLYSTCTISQNENEDNLNWILENLPFVCESIDEYITDELKSETTRNGYLQFLPGINDTDGFFVAKLRRTSDNDKTGY